MSRERHQQKAAAGGTEPTDASSMYWSESGGADARDAEPRSIDIAALFVDPRGAYFGIEGVELWDEQRDARKYEGPYPVVAHPPCERWGRYWGGGPSARERKVLGDDGGCFASALANVRRVGGVLEHPEASHAWAHHGLARPPFHGGWVQADALGGWTCCVAQGHYGHVAQKMTWLYAFGVALPELTWGRAGNRVRLDRGFHSAAERAASTSTVRSLPRLTKSECIGTPPQFRDVLLTIARSARKEVAHVG